MRSDWTNNRSRSIILGTLVIALLIFAAADLWRARSPDLAPGPGPSNTADTPFSFAGLIERRAEEFGLDPMLVAAVVDNESSFDPEKQSPDGAIGLMQIMPDTGRLAAQNLGLEQYSDESLWDPDTNLRLGSWYLSHLVEITDGDMISALAAYNAGPGRLEEWQQTDWWRSREGIDRIPVMETRSYVMLVLRDYVQYRR